MKRFEVVAEYHVKKLMQVSVEDGADPKDPANWKEIHSEHDQDCSLYDVESAMEAE